MPSAVCEKRRISTLAETVGFEPTCRLPDNTISSRARYDLFDTSPQIFKILYIIPDIDLFRKRLTEKIKIEKGE